jgi:aminoglycoside 3-N-acetyltransferase
MKTKLVMMKRDQSKSLLYQANQTLISRSDFTRAIKKVGIKRGDIIFVHSDISSFGKIVSENKDGFFDSLITILKNTVGESGTIIMPTFTYSFTQDKIFDVNNSPSTVGALTEYFRKLPDVERTVEPMLSVVVWGKQKRHFSEVGNESFGIGSIFHKLHSLKGKILFLGTRSCTFFHYIEKMHGVPYRFDKKISGRIRYQGRTNKTENIYFARRLNRKNVSHFSIAARDLEKQGLFKKIRIGHSAIASVRSDLLFNEVYNTLDRNPHYYLNSGLNDREEKTLT